MSQLIDWDRLARYVASESSPGERAEVERWLAGDPSRQAVLDDVRKRWAAAAVPVAVDVDRAWSRVASRIQDPSRQTVSDDVVLPGDDNTQRFATRVARFAVPIAAILLFGAGLAYWNVIRDGGTTGSGIAASSEYVVPRGGMQRTVTLSDSSEVILASASRLVVAADYGAGSRTVDLEGEALFRVRHDAARPFRVRAGAVVAEDLGTEFVVRRLASSNRITVAVSEGIVAVRSSAATSGGDTLRARDVAVAGDSGVSVRRDQDLDPYFAWTRGQLAFDNTPLSEVADELSRWFDLDVQVDSSVASRTYTGNLLTSTPLDEILQVVGSGADVRIERRGRGGIFAGPGYTGEIPMLRAGISREVAG